MDKEQSQTEIKASCLQFLAAFTALLGAFCMGTVLSYTSPAILSMQNEIVSVNYQIKITNQTKTTFLDQNDTQLISWIISIICLGGLVGSFLAGLICDLIGHRYFICISSLLCGLGWLCISFAINTIMVIIGRFVTGVAVGFLSSSVPVYVVEISTMKSRGFFGCSFQGFISLGILFISFCGMLFIEWRLLAIFCSIPAFLLAFLILIFPESPFWLIKKGRPESEVLNSLNRLRSNDCKNELNQIKEQIQNESSIDTESVDEEYIINRKGDNIDSLRSEGGTKMINCSIANINKVIDNFNSTIEIELGNKSKVPITDSSKSSTFFKDLNLPHVWKPLIFGLIIMSFQQFSGANGIFAVLQLILNNAKIDQLSEQQASFLVNLCFAIFAWLSTYVVNLFGRRTLLLFSSFGYVTAHLMIGGFYLLKEHHYNELANQLSYLPLIGLIVFFFVHAMGYGSVCWFVIPEMAISYRNKISSICVATNWLMSFLVMNSLIHLFDLINYSGTFILFAFIGLLSAIFVGLFIIETKDKTAKQIKARFYTK